MLSAVEKAAIWC